MVRPLRGLVIAAAFALSTAAAAQVQVNQTFIPQGPSPKFGAIDLVQSGDAPPNGTVGGAVQAILLDPALGSQTMFIAGVNGGIWRTTDGGASWKALTDNQASLSIASLALDPTDATGKTLIAGIGITSNGGWNNFNVGNEFGRGGARTGLLYSADGGNTWSALGAASLTGQSVIGVAAAGGTILAATFEEQKSKADHGGNRCVRLVPQRQRRTELRPRLRVGGSSRRSSDGAGRRSTEFRQLRHAELLHVLRIGHVGEHAIGHRRLRLA